MASISWAFGWQPIEEMMALYRPHVAPERSLAAFDGGEIVGGAEWFPSDVVIPGETLGMAGVSGVGVLPTHRRRGLLTRLMDRQLTEFHETGIPLAGLFPSESIIYGRFGYGIASFSEKWSIARQHTSYAERIRNRQGHRSPSLRHHRGGRGHRLPEDRASPGPGDRGSGRPCPGAFPVGHAPRKGRPRHAAENMLADPELILSPVFARPGAPPRSR